MAKTENIFGELGGGGTSYKNPIQGTVPVGSSQATVTIDTSKNYILFWNFKTTDTSYVYNGMWTIDKGVLSSPIIVTGSSAPTITVSGTTLTIKNAGSSVRGEYILVEVE